MNIISTTKIYLPKSKRLFTTHFGLMASEAEIAGQHLPIYESFYNELNPLQVPAVDAETVAHFLKRSGLGIFQLSQIWEISDRRKKGSLDKVGIFTSFKLVAAVQQGRLLSSVILTDDSIQPPKFETPSAQPTSFPTSSSIYNISPVLLPSIGDTVGVNYRTQRSASVTSKSSMIDYFAISTEEQTKYETIFYSLKPVKGRLSGEQCKSVLLNSHLPQVQLARIWELADVDRDGHLDKYEMFIALHLVYRCLHGEMLPNHLPISLIHPMKRVQCSMSGVKNSKTRSESITSLPTSSYTPVSDSNIFQNDTTTTWPIDVNLYREVFQKLDTDADGFVSGMNVKTYAMKFGILQPILAHIWTLVDVAKAGRLNLEQFALWSEIMKVAQSNTQLPEHLPQHLLPPTMRTALAHSSSKRNSVGNISANSNSGSIVNAALEENEKIIELNKEIEKALENRRRAEQDLFQLEADTLVKNSEIKNLELELQTLTTTVKQLEHQKTEASKRLLELDTKIEKLESTCKEQNERMVSEEERLQRVKAEIAQANDNYTTESKAMQALQAELATTDQKLEMSKRLITDENQKMERFVDELTVMERQNDAYTFEIDRIEKLTLELTELMKKCKSSDSNEDDVIQMDNDILNAQFEHILLPMNKLSNASNKLMPKFNDLFKDDPFDGADASENKYSNSFSDDPFASSTANNVQLTNAPQFADFSKFTAFGS